MMKTVLVSLAVLLFAALLGLAPSAVAMFGRGTSPMGKTTTAPPPPTTMACDIGPTYSGSVPAAAIQAGFTHCRANYDFTQTAAFTDIAGTHTWSTLSSWFTCSSSATAGLLMAFDGGFTPNIGCDTSHQNIALDGSTQTFQLSYSPADQSGGKYGNNVHTIAGTNNTPLQSAYYVEWVLRTNINTRTSQACGTTFCSTYSELSTFNSTIGSGTCFAGIDIELDNFNDPNGGANRWNCANGTGGIGPPWSVQYSNPTTAYFTQGALVTTDGANNFGACNYQGGGVVSGLPAGAFLGCVSLAATPSGGQPTPSGANMFAYFATGAINGTYQGIWVLSSTLTTYIQRATFWQCTSAPCYNNPIITTHP